MPRRMTPRVELLEDRITPVQAATGTVFVSTLSDVVDGDTSGVDALIANPGADGLISLTEAMRAADAAPDANVVVLPLGPDGATIALDGNTLDPRSLAGDSGSTGPSQYVVTTAIAVGTFVTQPTAPGSAPTIARFGQGPAFRLFDVRPGGSLTLDGVELRGGLALGGSGSNGGGGNDRGPRRRVFNQGTLVVTNSTLTREHRPGRRLVARATRSRSPAAGAAASATPDDGFNGGGPNGGEGTGEGSDAGEVRRRRRRRHQGRRRRVRRWRRGREPVLREGRHGRVRRGRRRRRVQ